MIINVNKFEDVIRKATLDFTLETVQLNFDKDKVTAKIFNSSEDAIVFLNVENDIMPITSKHDEVQFNFIDPHNTIKPYLSLIDSEQADVEIKKEKIILKSDNQRSNIFFCSPIVVKVFNREDVKPGIEYFTELAIDDNFVNGFNKIKKIGSRFGKIYITIKDNTIYMETMDKTNRSSNGFSFNMGNIEMPDLSMCFNYKNIINLMNVLAITGIDDFHINLAYLEAQRLGMMYVTNTDNSEKYYLMSKSDL